MYILIIKIIVFRANLNKRPSVNVMFLNKHPLLSRKLCLLKQGHLFKKIIPTWGCLIAGVLVWQRALIPSFTVRDIANCWFSCYLSIRKQFVTINVFDSEIQSFQNRVPQGSVLGPLLFFNTYQWSSWCCKGLTIFSLCRWYVSA